MILNRCALLVCRQYYLGSGYLITHPRANCSALHEASWSLASSMQPKPSPLPLSPISSASTSKLLPNILLTDVQYTQFSTNNQVTFSVSRVADESHPTTSSTAKGCAIRVRDHQSCQDLFLCIIDRLQRCRPTIERCKRVSWTPNTSPGYRVHRQLKEDFWEPGSGLHQCFWHCLGTLRGGDSCFWDPSQSRNWWITWYSDHRRCEPFPNKCRRNYIHSYCHVENIPKRADAQGVDL